jgi:CheY-like chemotaxis protein
VTCEIASTAEEFCEKIAKKDYSFIFIAPNLYENHKNTILKFAPSSKVVLLTEFGEVLPDSTMSILAIPVHSISVANILNGVSEIYSYREVNASFVGFTAPDAKILVVDDIKTNLTVVEGLLLPYNMQVDLRKSGQDAIRAVQSVRYDLIFMDHWMPEMDGVEAARRIRELDDPYYREVPIIALTANALADAQDMFLENRFNAFLAKPIDTVKLNIVLEKWLPKEKQTIPAPSDAKKESPADIPEIEGVDTSKGISLTGGSIERYWRTLFIFC